MWIYRERDVRIPIWIWADPVDDGALAQAKALANLPFAEHVALMADAHVGYGMPIGGVLATREQVLPYGVGGDIGCGMCALGTDFRAADLAPADLAHLRRRLLRRIPVGKKSRERGDRHVHEFAKSGLYERIAASARAKAGRKAGERVLDAERIASQVGTLGSGNHFLELQRDEAGRLWVMLHSGSRNMGQQVVRWYHALAREKNERERARTPAELAWLPVDSPEGRDYLEKMELALEYARVNRETMVQDVLDVLGSELGIGQAGEVVNIHHNYAALEEHGGRSLWVHRKGATLAAEGVAGIVPGSMGTASYVVEGAGNAESLRSCSHGAGRVLGRTQARNTLDLEAERARLRGVVHGLDDASGLDEAPSAYKDIDAVIAAQSDLLRVRHRLVPLASVKG